jgi:chromosome segregation ATPase
MSEEVVQWLGEINRLKQQLATLQQELKTSQSSEASWRQRYTEEAQQRRTEARLAKEQFEQMQVQIQALQQTSKTLADPTEVAQALQQEIAAIADLDLLKARLLETSQERNQALKALQQERDNHEKTRKSLTSVINDTIEQLSKMKKDS